MLPIGGADMPVVISLLNSYAGLAAAATGFALDNNVLIICRRARRRARASSSSMMMSKAMNRSFANVLFGAFGTGDGDRRRRGAGGRRRAASNEATVEDAAERAQGRAVGDRRARLRHGGVAGAARGARPGAARSRRNGATVQYAIHPVAGRMPGHMNVLLAEANVPYDQLFDLDDINDDFARTDVALVVGANDVVNPAAKTNPASPIYGMPVFNVEQARGVIVLKRSMNPGFAGIENELFVQPNTMMVLGDAKKTLRELLQAVA